MEETPQAIVYLVWASSDEEPATVTYVRSTYALAADSQQDEFARLNDGQPGHWVHTLEGTAYAGVGDHTKHRPIRDVLVDSVASPTKVVWVEEWTVE